MEENNEPKEAVKEEKKEIKISLWTFYVLVASLVMLLAAVISGWMLVAKQTQLERELLNNQSSVVQPK